MSGTSNPYGAPYVDPGPAPSGQGPVEPDPDRLQRALGDLAVDVAVVVAWFALAALICAAIWVKVTPLPHYTRTADNATMDEAQLAKQVATDGWFFAIAAVAGLVSGFALLVLRRRSPILMVLLVAGGGALATYLMLQLGLAFGPPDPNGVFAGVPVGAQVPLRIKPDADGIRFVWSIAALVGALLALWGREARENRRTRPETTLFPNLPTG
ncbi:MAG: hypothetical protein JWQ74_1937 [Marmoricola sp.]|nr:hypothetical protein [Marmoricola sp.]